MNIPKISAFISNPEEPHILNVALDPGEWQHQDDREAVWFQLAIILHTLYFQPASQDNLEKAEFMCQQYLVRMVQEGQLSSYEEHDLENHGIQHKTLWKYTFHEKLRRQTREQAYGVSSFWMR